METHHGVSSLRKMNAKVLAEQKEIVILHDHSEPIAVLIPYALYMAVQELRDRLEQ